MSLLRKIMNWLFLVVGLAFIAYYLACGLSLRFNQSMLWVWPMVGAAFILRFIIVQISITRGVPLPYPPWFLWTFRALCALALALFLLVEGFVISGMVGSCPAGVDYIIVLGAKTGSLAIDRRIEAAYEYLLDNPTTIAIASGGQGTDEPESEAQYIADGLVQHGIARDRILIEDKSISTSENMRFSAALVTKIDASICIVSSDYHVFRARHLAQKVFEGDVYALSSPTVRLYLPHYTVREFFTTVVDTLRGNMAFR